MAGEKNIREKGLNHRVKNPPVLDTMTGENSMKLPYSAVIMDLDRTLLRTDKSVSEYTRGVLREWRQAGAYLFAATARPERAIGEYRELIGFDAVTTLNGARTITPGGIYEKAIMPEHAAALLTELEKIGGVIVSVEAENGIYANAEIPLWHPEVIKNLRRLPEQQKIYKILASHPGIPPEAIRIDLPNGIYSTVADKKLRQYMSSAATKWAGTMQMLQDAGLCAGQAVCFGDDNDDLEPIIRCGYGVAVGNALDHVKEAADEVTQSNDEDGVARCLERLISRANRGTNLLQGIPFE